VNDPRHAPRFAAPLVAVDDVTVTTSDTGLALRATKLIRADDPYMAAHFPSMTVFPGVFIIEAVRQAVMIALGAQEPGPEIRQVRSARFVAPLFAGDTLSMQASATRSDDGGSLSVDAECWRGDGVTAARVRLEMGPLDA
jgi:3-hydroxyacyl-[acyl-carrier-protein] dehydratase